MNTKRNDSFQILQLALVGLALLFCIELSAKDSKKKQATPLTDLRLVEGDEQGNEMKSLKTELLVSKTESNAILQAQKLIKKYKGTALEPDLHFRLAELYMRKSKTDRFFEIHRESETVVQFAPRVSKQASSRASVQAAADTYTTIQNRFPSFGQMDLVIFNHAFARQILGQEKEAEALYTSLISKYGRSPLVPDARLALGEMSFNKGHFQVALEHFNAIKAYPNARVYPYGLYKAAWTHYNLREAQMGLTKLEEVVAYGKMVAEKGIDARLDLRKEALNDMCLFYEDVKPSAGAFDYFRAQAGEKEVGAILLRMATLYDRHSRFNDQKVVLDRFVKELPQSPLLPQVHNDLVLVQDHLRQKDQAVASLENFALLCQPNGRWVKSQMSKTNPAATVSASCVQLLSETSLKMARKWLKAWKKLPSDTTYADAAEKAFDIHLRAPSVSGEELATTRFAYAELLFARGQYRRASVEYATVSRSITKGPSEKGSLSHDASYAALISLEKAVGDNAKWSSSDETSFHQLALDYLKTHPKGPYRLDIEYKMALLSYEKERFDEAAPLFLRIGREFFNTEKGQKAQDLYLDILNLKKDYHGVRTYAQELLKLKLEPARQVQLQKVYEQAYFLEVQVAEEKGQLREAIAGYEAFAQNNPTAELTEKAMWNAMQLHFKLNDTWHGALAAEQFASKYSNSPQALNALMRSAQTFEQMAQLQDAARVLEKLAVKDPKSSARWLELAGDFYALDRMPGRARAIYTNLKANADATQKAALINKMEVLEMNYGTAASQAEIHRTMVDQNIQPKANLVKVEAVEAQLVKNQMTEAFNDARRLLAVSGLSANHKARLRLVQAKVLEQEFLKQSVKSRAERVAQVLALKTEKLEKAQEALQSTIKYGDATVSLEAFERLHGCYASYVKALKEMPLPAGLTAADESVFRGEIERLVIPLEEKSVDTLVQALTFARKQNYLDNTVARLEAQLAMVNQQRDVRLNLEVKRPQIALPLVAGVQP